GLETGELAPQRIEQDEIGHGLWFLLGLEGDADRSGRPGEIGQRRRAGVDRCVAAEAERPLAGGDGVALEGQQHARAAAAGRPGAGSDDEPLHRWRGRSAAATTSAAAGGYTDEREEERDGASQEPPRTPLEMSHTSASSRSVASFLSWRLARSRRSPCRWST